MKLFAVMLFLSGLTFPVYAADAVAETGLAEIRIMGGINGQALACSRIDAVSNIKKIIIKHVPKTRRYGEIFEQSTNDAYLAHVKNDKAICSDTSVLTAQIEEAAKALQTVFMTHATEKTQP